MYNRTKITEDILCVTNLKDYYNEISKRPVKHCWSFFIAEYMHTAKFESKYNTSPLKYCSLICQLQNGGHFVSPSICWLMSRKTSVSFSFHVAFGVFNHLCFEFWLSAYMIITYHLFNNCWPHYYSMALSSLTNNNRKIHFRSSINVKC